MGRKLLLFLVVIAFVAWPGSSYAGCSSFWKICGNSSGTGTITVTFNVGTGCVAAGAASVTPGSTPEQICYALRDTLSNDCANCTFKCAVSSEDSSCWVIGHDSCPGTCSTRSETDCCGSSVIVTEPEWG